MWQKQCVSSCWRQVATLAWMVIIFCVKIFIRSGCSLQFAFKLFSNSFTWQELDDSIYFVQSILWQGQSVTKWSKSWDKWLFRLVSCINQTINQTMLSCGQFNWRLKTRFVPRHIFCWTLVRFKIDIRRSPSFPSQTFAPISSTRKKQSAVSRSSSEFEMVSLDADYAWLECQLCNFGNAWNRR